GPLIESVFEIVEILVIEVFCRSGLLGRSRLGLGRSLLLALLLELVELLLTILRSIAGRDVLDDSLDRLVLLTTEVVARALFLGVDDALLGELAQNVAHLELRVVRAALLVD